MNPKRQALIDLSAIARQLIQAGQAETVNQALIELYSGGRDIKFNTLRQWNELGKKIKKGSKAFAVWARPKKVHKPEPNNDEEMRYFPMCFLFSEEQVEDDTRSVAELPEDYVTPDPLPVHRYGCREIEVRYRPVKIDLVHEKITCSRDAYESFMMFFDPDSMQHREFFWVLFLNNANNPIGAMKLSEGGITGTVVDTRILLQTALKVHATNIMVAHNHPSGKLTPSDADKTLTAKLKDAAKLLELKLFDHLIMTPAGYYSFADDGQI